MIVLNHELIRVTRPKRIAEIAAGVVDRARALVGVVVAAGGDGTISAVAQATLGSELPFGVLPPQAVQSTNLLTARILEGFDSQLNQSKYARETLEPSASDWGNRPRGFRIWPLSLHSLRP